MFTNLQSFLLSQFTSWIPSTPVVLRKSKRDVTLQMDQSAHVFGCLAGSLLYRVSVKSKLAWDTVYCGSKTTKTIDNLAPGDLHKFRLQVILKAEAVPHVAETFMKLYDDEERILQLFDENIKDGEASNKITNDDNIKKREGKDKPIDEILNNLIDVSKDKVPIEEDSNQKNCEDIVRENNNVSQEKPVEGGVKNSNNENFDNLATQNKINSQDNVNTVINKCEDVVELRKETASGDSFESQNRNGVAIDNTKNNQNNVVDKVTSDVNKVEAAELKGWYSHEPIRTMDGISYIIKVKQQSKAVVWLGASKQGGWLESQLSAVVWVTTECEGTSVASFCMAVQSGYLKQVQQYLEEDCDLLNAVSSLSGLTPLTIAVRKGNVKMVHLLLTAGADVNLKTSSEQSPLQLALYHQHEDIALALLERGADTQACDVNGCRWEHSAVDGGGVSAVRFVLSRGGDVAVRDRNGWTPLFRAVCQGASDELVQVLCDAGADINVTDYAGLPLRSVAMMLKDKNGKPREKLLRLVDAQYPHEMALQNFTRLTKKINRFLGAASTSDNN